jgi:hypothetical protein
MSNYTQITNFTAKDSLPAGNAAKKVKGVDFDGEFAAISTAITSKADTAGATLTGNLNFNDDIRARFGTDADLQVYHDGTNSFIKDSGTGNLKVLTSSFLVKNQADNEVILKGTPDGSVDLYYNNGKKFETTATGAKVTGALVSSSKVGIGVDTPLKPLHIFNATTDVVARIESGDETAGLELIDATTTAQVKVANGLMTIGTDTSDAVADSAISLRVDAVEKVRIEDDSVIIKDNARVNDNLLMSFGTGIDMSVSHVTATNTNTIQNNNSRPMVFNGVSFVFQNQGANEKLMEMTANGNVELYQNNSKKFETVTTGVQVTGETNTNSLIVDRATTGIITQFKSNGSLAGAVRTTTSNGISDITLGSGSVGVRFVNAAGGSIANISPTSVTTNGAQDDLIDLGRASARWDNIYATNGTINTSDANDKQSIEELTEAETRVAQACKGLVRKFKWNSAVEKKGSEARYHFGVIAQDVQSAFEVEGLDAGDYGVFVSSTWEDEEGVEQTRLGVRYTELLAFIIGGL